MTDIETIRSQGPFSTQRARDYIGGWALLTEALGLSAGDVAGMSEDEQSSAAEDWVNSGAAGEFFSGVALSVVDNRFDHETLVADWEIDEVAFVELSTEDSQVNVNIELHEDEEGFQKRLAAEIEARRATPGATAQV